MGRTRRFHPFRHPHSRRRKVGLPPGTLIRPESPPEAAARVLTMDFNATAVQEHEAERFHSEPTFRSEDTVSWIHVCGVHDVDVLHAVGAHFGLHPLMLEDIATPHQRPKLETHDAFLFLVAHALHARDEASIRSEQISLVLGPSFLLSFQESTDDVFQPIRERVCTGRGRIRTAPPSYLAYALLDLTVDRYFVALETLVAESETLEDQILDAPDDDTQTRLHALRRDLSAMRRLTWPMRDLLNQLVRLESPLWPDDVRPFVRDVYDHAIQVIDLVESQRDIVNGLMDLLMSALSQRMNEIMKVLTVIGTIFLPLTFVVGIYGMNFERMPELGWRYGYPAAMLGMGLLAAGLLIYFRRHDWI